jgi:signal transduction histidine kinase
MAGRWRAAWAWDDGILDVMESTRGEDNMLWALSMMDKPAIVLDADGMALHANPQAHALAAGIFADAADPGVDRLLELLPPGALDTARAEGRWSADVTVQACQRVMAVSVFSDRAPAGHRSFAVFEDATARAGREQETRQRHDELTSTYTHLATAQEQLLQAEKMASIGQLAAGVAHEINNPIGYVHSNLGTLRDYVSSLLALLDAYASATQSDGIDRPELTRLRERLDIEFIVGDLPNLLDESREGIERVTKIVQDLKEFSHVGRDEKPRAVDLHKGLDSTLNIVWNDLKYKVQLDKHYGDLPLVECHPSELNQVFMNLLINAGQAIVERGTITLTTGVDEDVVWVSIADSGCGIAKDAQQRIFEPFFTTKPIGRGTGLGLAIAYRIVAKHNGRIEVQSRVGGGSTFRVVLPIRQPAPDAIAAQDSERIAVGKPGLM